MPSRTYDPDKKPISVIDKLIEDTDKVEGKWNDDLMTQVKAPAEIPAPKTN